MSRAATLAVAIFFATMATTPSIAQKFSGRGLYETCKLKEGASRNNCIAYILGTLHSQALTLRSVVRALRKNGHDTKYEEIAHQNAMACLPRDGVNFDDLVRTVNDFISREPGAMERPATSSILVSVIFKYC